MKIVMKAILLLATAIVVIFVIGSVLNILIPAFQQLPDLRRRSEAPSEMRRIMESLDRYYDQNKRYPKSLEELGRSYPSIMASKDLYWYFPEHASCSEPDDHPVLIEKPGHYKVRECGYIGFPPGICVFKFAKEYQNVLDVYIYQTKDKSDLEKSW